MASIRYRVLKASRGKCELCGISSKISPVDIDHIVPQSKADKSSLIVKDGDKMHVDDERNLQALCFRCNRAKRDTDDTDFRLPLKKLVRDNIPALIEKEGNKPQYRVLEGEKLRYELYEKLTEEHAELISDKTIDEVVDMIEVLFSIANSLGYDEASTTSLLHEKRVAKGGFSKGFFLEGINRQVATL